MRGGRRRDRPDTRRAGFRCLTSSSVISEEALRKSSARSCRGRGARAARCRRDRRTTPPSPSAECRTARRRSCRTASWSALRPETSFSTRGTKPYSSKAPAIVAQRGVGLDGRRRCSHRAFSADGGGPWLQNRRAKGNAADGAEPRLATAALSGAGGPRWRPGTGARRRAAHPLGRLGCGCLTGRNDGHARAPFARRTRPDGIIPRQVIPSSRKVLPPATICCSAAFRPASVNAFCSAPAPIFLDDRPIGAASGHGRRRAGRPRRGPAPGAGPWCRYRRGGGRAPARRCECAGRRRSRRQAARRRRRAW